LSSTFDVSGATGAGTAKTRRSYSYELVLVVYRSRELMNEFLRKLPDDVPLVVVDNAQGEDGVAELLVGRTATRYLDGPGRGFGAAANLAARTSEYEHVVFLSPDCLPSTEQLDALVAELDADPRLALVSVTTVQPDGRIELGVGGWEPTFRRALVHAVGAHKVLPRAGLFARPAAGRPIDLDWLGGACMAVPRALFLELGGYDESYFVYSEDVDFSRRVRAAGLRQLIRTDLLVPHIGAGSGEARPRMLQMRGYYMMQYVRRHKRRATSEGIRLALTVGYLARFVACRLRARDGQAVEHAAYVTGMWRRSAPTG
jgi:N-acetylglucosaminyl-diphospho-decaprenol L-rhamnosyltransferase